MSTRIIYPYFPFLTSGQEYILLLRPLFFLFTAFIFAYFIIKYRRHLFKLEIRSHRLLGFSYFQGNEHRKDSKYLCAIADNVPALLAYFDTDERFLFHNSADRWINQLSCDPLGKTVLEVYGQDLYNLFSCDIKKALTGMQTKSEHCYISGRGERFFNYFYKPDLDNSGHVKGCFVMITDITKLKRDQQKLSNLARTDVLTGLANRIELADRLVELFKIVQMNGHRIGCLYCDIDKFKEINDSFGHAGGDQILIQFSHRLQFYASQSYVVARISGDEFVVAIEIVKCLTELNNIAHSLVLGMDCPFSISGISVKVTTSIGVAVADLEIDTPDILLQKADTALYTAKRLGRNNFSIYSDP